LVKSPLYPFISINRLTLVYYRQYAQGRLRLQAQVEVHETAAPRKDPKGVFQGAGKCMAWPTLEEYTQKEATQHN
jgi:hypothetical protein